MNLNETTLSIDNLAIVFSQHMEYAKVCKQIISYAGKDFKMNKSIFSIFPEMHMLKFKTI